jgi:hypothetical protein
MIERIKEILQQQLPEGRWQDISVSFIAKREKDRIFMLAVDGDLRRAAIVKIDRRNSAGLAKNFKVLSRVRQLHPFLRHTTPRPLYYGDLEGENAYIEEFVDAKSMRAQSTLAQALYLKHITRWIGEFNRLSLRPVTRRELIAHYVGDESLRALCRAAHTSEEALLKALEPSLGRENHYVAYAHGDFTFYNILLAQDSLCVVDWSAFRETSPLWYDLLHFFSFWYYIKTKGDFKKAFVDSFSRSSFASYTPRRAAERYARSFKQDVASAKPALLLVLAGLFAQKEKSKTDILECFTWALTSHNTIFEP